MLCKEMCVQKSCMNKLQVVSGSRDVGSLGRHFLWTVVDDKNHLLWHFIGFHCFSSAATFRNNSAKLLLLLLKQQRQVVLGVCMKSSGWKMSFNELVFVFTGLSFLRLTKQDIYIFANI